MKLVNVQTILSESVLNELKEKTGVYTTKGAIAKAVEHFLTCQHCQDKGLEMRLKKVMIERANKKN